MTTRTHIFQPFLLGTPLLLAVACGGATPDGTTTPNVAGPVGASATMDVQIDVPVTALSGMVFVPEALGRPSMPLVEAKKKKSIEQQRAAIAKETDKENREVLSQLLATTLFQDSKLAKDDAAKQAALYEEATKVLREAIVANGGKAVDAVTLQMLAVLSYIKTDYKSASDALAELLALNPKAKDATQTRGWLVHALLLQERNAEALAALQGVPLTAGEPELAYVAAWAKFRTMDYSGAWQAMSLAAKGWRDAGAREAIERDLLLFAGRTRAAVPDAIAAIKAFVGKGDSNEMVFRLSRAYSFAAHYPETIETVDKLLVGGESTTLPATELPKLRWLQTQSALNAGQLEPSVRLAKQTIEALVACGAACEADKATLFTALRNVGMRYHSIFATSGDAAYYQPARDIYTALAGAGDTSPELGKLASNIDQSKKSMKPGTGTHDKDVLAAMLGLHAQEAMACYEAVLAGAKSTAGAVTLSFDVATDGKLTNVVSNPTAGGQGLAAVAACLVARAASWPLYGRGKSGVTHVTMPFAFDLKK